MNYKRIFLIVLDSVGVGATLDANEYRDRGANTLKNTIEATNIRLPNLTNLGLIDLIYNTSLSKYGYHTKAIPYSVGKDTLTGHLEMMGIYTKIPFKTFTETGFPSELIHLLEEKTGRSVIGNKNASGTEIIEELGDIHMKTGSIIVYTSADSVLQIAAHEEIVPLEELYSICEIARELTLKDEWKVGRIIARPFIGTSGNFTRTSNRKDYALNPADKTVLDHLKENNYDVICIGKINDIFNGCGISKSTKTKNNLDGINKIIETIETNFMGLCFANLNDFDSLYGHRRNPRGYSESLLEFDIQLPKIIKSLKNDDLLIITADHGNDPTFRGTDHTREMVPLLVYNENFDKGLKLPILNTFADIGATIADNFNVEHPKIGHSFLAKINN